MSAATINRVGALLRRTGTSRHRVGLLENLAFNGVGGESQALRSALEDIRVLAKQDTPSVLLVGETGTGKELLARALHSAGPNAHLPFVTLECGSAPVEVVEAELFGYEVNAFEDAPVIKQGLLELVGSGTVFLDNIESLPARLQPKLLHALSKGSARRVGGRDTFPVTATLITATARPLEALVAADVFREDLFFALNAPRVSVPRLAERDEDVVLLAQRFLDETAREQGLRPMSLTVEAHAALLSYDWPGNVRELRTVMHRAAEVCDEAHVRPEHLRIGGRSRTTPTPSATSAAIRLSGRSLREIEKDAIAAALYEARGDTSEAAITLDIPVNELKRKVREYGLTSWMFDGA